MADGPDRMRHIGILAHSADGAALCFLEMVREAARRLGAHQHPEITLSILPMGPTLEQYERNDLAGSPRTSRARRSGSPTPAAISSCAPTTPPTSRSSWRREPLPLPGLHIAEIVAERAAADGRRLCRIAGDAMDDGRDRSTPPRSPGTASRCGHPRPPIARSWTTSSSAS